MKKMRVLSLILSVTTVFSLLASPAMAAGVNSTAEPTAVVAEAEEETTSVAKVDVDLDEVTIDVDVTGYDEDVELGGFSVNAMMAQTVLADIDVNEESPAIIELSKELDDMTVLNADGQKVVLTDEEKQQILGMYAAYLQQWQSNENILGVQVPFYLQENDNGEFGIMGELLTLAGWSPQDLRDGKYSFDDIMGLMMNFYYGDTYALQFYSADVAAARDEAMAFIKNSGAKTEVQKLELLNSWLAQQDSFDMGYIMKAGTDSPMNVEVPVKNEHWDEVYAGMYAQYEQSIRNTFVNMIRQGVEADFKSKFYTNAIQEAYKAGFMQNPDAQAAVAGVVEQQVYEGALAEMKSYVEAGYMTQEQAEAQAHQSAAEYMASEEGQATVQGAMEQAAASEAEKFMAENAEAIEADPEAFVLNVFGPEAAAQFDMMFQAFMQDAEENGVEVDPVNAPGYKMTISQIVEMSMDQPMDELGGMSPNEMIPGAAAQAATGLADGIIDYWEGTHMAALAFGKSVCLGYTRAFSFLVQCMHPEIYLKNGATDYTKAENWKVPDELYYNAKGELDPEAGYVTDFVRIYFDADVTMYGVTQGDFDSDHFFNAAKVDGKWYYLDCCYTDVYAEVMSRDRVEVNGYMNNIYFLFSHDSCHEMYDGFYSRINSLYSTRTYTQNNRTGEWSSTEKTDKTGTACHDDYQQSWISRIKSNAYPMNNYIYYVYDSTDTIKMMDDYNNMMNAGGTDSIETDMKKVRHQLVRHSMNGKDTDTVNDDGVDSSAEVLIDFNHKNDYMDDDEQPKSLVRNSRGQMIENTELTAAYQEMLIDQQRYPSVSITAALDAEKNVIYFNVSNKLFAMDLSNYSVKLVKEYNDVYARRDPSVLFGGMAFTTITKDEYEVGVKSEPNHYKKVLNAPIAGITLKHGKLYVDIATNYSYVAGRTDHDMYETYTENGKEHTRTSSKVFLDENGMEKSFGYEYQETNYNPNYNQMSQMKGDDQMSQMGQMMGYREDTNDNSEFMWAGVFTEILDINAYRNPKNDYQTVSIDAFCGRDSFTEQRNSDGIIKQGTRQVLEGSALDHHYYATTETYYTKDDNGKWNTGEAVICTMCNYGLTEPLEPGENQMGNFGGMGGDYDFDATYEEMQENYKKNKAEFDAAKAKAKHVFSTDLVNWTDNGDGTVTAKILPNTDIYDEPCYEGDYDVFMKRNESKKCMEKDSSAYVTTVGNGGATLQGQRVEEDGYTYYVASGTINGKAVELREVQTFTAGQHTYVVNWDWSKDFKKATATYACTHCTRKEVVTGSVTSTAPTAATCTKGSLSTYTATATSSFGQTATSVRADVEISPKLGHDWEYQWNWKTEAAGMSATLTHVCKRDPSHNEKPLTANVTMETTATCTTGGTTTFNAVEPTTGMTTTQTLQQDALGHVFAGNARWAWAKDYSKATATMPCLRTGCGEMVTLDGTVTSQVVAEATCDKGQQTKYTATAVAADGTKVTDTETVATSDPLGHKWTYAWAWTKEAAGYSAVATRTCQNDASHVQTKVADVTMTTTATCEKAGKETYAAKAVFIDAVVTDENVVDVAAYGHSYTLTTIDWASDYSSAKAKFTCSRDAAHVVYVEDKAPEAVEMATGDSMQYTATFEFEGKTYQDVQIVSLDGLYEKDGALVYYENGKPSTYTGFTVLDSDEYYVVNGVVDGKTTDVIKDANGALGSKDAWYNVVNSKVAHVDTVAKNSKGWWKITDGMVEFGYNGFASNDKGNWYIENGKVTFAKDDVIKDANGALGKPGAWYYVKGSKVTYTNTVAKNANGWWCIHNGVVDFTCNSVEKNDNGWWKIQNGKVNFSFNGIASNSKGSWYIKNGKVDFNYTGTVKYNGKTYRIVKGKVS